LFLSVFIIFVFKNLIFEFYLSQRWGMEEGSTYKLCSKKHKVLFLHKKIGAGIKIMVQKEAATRDGSNKIVPV